MSAFDTPTTASAGQQWNAQDYAIDAGFVPLLGGAVARLLDPRAGERILDLGCGDGVLSTELALSGARIHGVDASPELVVAARARGVDAQVMDGHALAFDSEFDAVFSNAALHWMGNPDRVLEGVRVCVCFRMRWSQSSRPGVEVGGLGHGGATPSPATKRFRNVQYRTLARSHRLRVEGCRLGSSRALSRAL